MVASLVKTQQRRFPDLLTRFSTVEDPRQLKGRQYRMEEILMGGMSLFLFREGSRNQLNNHRQDGYFSEHYQQMYGLKLPHQDTVSDVLCELPPAELEQVKMDLMSKLFDQKWLKQYRLQDQYYLVAVDATGVVSFDERHCEHCLTRKLKGEKTIYFHYVLEAKLITSQGHAFSLATEWIENPSGNFDKQDCERKAFVRLAAKLKKQYPRLPICILADGLYPYENAFKICEQNAWKYIFVLKEDSLKTVQEELVLTRRRAPIQQRYTIQNGWRITDEYRFQTDIPYHGKYTLHWMQCIETRHKILKPGTNSSPKTETSCFEFVTNIRPKKESVGEITFSGRLRWKIENEGFNIQKCNDYELSHKFSRKSYFAMQNYYTLLQIAHAINQLVEKSKVMTEIRKLRPKESIRNIWDKLKGYMIFVKPIIFLINNTLDPEYLNIKLEPT